MVLGWNTMTTLVVYFEKTELHFSTKHGWTKLHWQGHIAPWKIWGGICFFSRSIPLVFILFSDIISITTHSDTMPFSEWGAHSDGNKQNYCGRSDAYHGRPITREAQDRTCVKRTAVISCLAVMPCRLSGQGRRRLVFTCILVGDFLKLLFYPKFFKSINPYM